VCVCVCVFVYIYINSRRKKSVFLFSLFNFYKYISVPDWSFISKRNYWNRSNNV